MTTFASDDFFRKYRKLKIFLLILMPILVVSSFIFWFYIGQVVFVITSLTLSLIDIGIVGGLLSKRHYNWILAFVILMIIGLLSMMNKWPYNSFINFYGIGGFAYVSLFSSIIFLKRYRNVPFLRYIGFSSHIVFFLIGMGLIFKLRHLPYAGILLYAGAVILIIFLFAFIFILPGSNYVNWERTERVAFLRAIIIPVIYIFITFSLLLVFPEIWAKIISPPPIPWNIEHVELLEKAGLH